MTDNSKSKARIQAEKKRAAARNREYNRRLKLLEKFGIYEPKGHELTEYRKSQINKKYNEFQQYIDDPRERFQFASARKLEPKLKKKFLSDAEQMSMVKTRQGVFISREGQRRVEVRHYKKSGEFKIVQTGKVKWGPNAGKRQSYYTSVAPYDRLESEERRLRQMADDAGSLKKGEILSFVVIENGTETGSHKNTYDSVEGVMNALNRYHVDNMPARLTFFRLVRVVKSTRVEWRKDHPTREKMTARGRAGLNPDGTRKPRRGRSPSRFKDK